MNKKLPAIIVGTIVLLVIVIGFVFWQKSSVKTQALPQAPTAKKVDMKSQPLWVQNLTLAASKGTRKGSRGLDNVTITISKIPAGMVETLTYTISYSYKTAQGDGSGGFFTDTQIKVDGAETFTRTFDFGTCSTKSCVRLDGVTALDVEIDFTTKDGNTPIWSGTVDVK
jgi:hypothetical protein